MNSLKFNHSSFAKSFRKTIYPGILVQFSNKMISYSKVCKILTDAVPITVDFYPLPAIIPSDDIPTEDISDSYGIKQKSSKYAIINELMIVDIL